MHGRAWFAARAVFLVVVACGLQAVADERQKIAVLDLQAKTQLPRGMAQLLNELLLTAVQESGDFSVLGSSDITSIMTLEEQRIQLTGCADNACLAEIGGALGVNLLMASSLGTLGENYLFNIKIVDTSSANVVKRASEMVERDDAKLVEAIKLAVRKVVAPLTAASPAPASATATAMPEAATSQNLHPARVEKSSGLMDYAPWITLGLTGAAAVAGGVAIGLGLSGYSAMDDEYQGSKDWEDLGDSADTKMIAGEVLIGVALAAGVGTVVLFLVGGDDEPAREPAISGVVPVRGGAVVTTGWSF